MKISPADSQDIEGRATSILHKRLTDQLRAILHHPDFRQLEATWVGLRYLINQLEPGANLKVKVFDVAKRELARDHATVFPGLRENFFDFSGGEPFGLFISDYEFDRSPADIRLLESLSILAASAHAPFVAGPSPSMFDLMAFQEYPSLRDLAKPLEGRRGSMWRAFRESEDARFIGLVMPRILGRLPYGANTLPVEDFPFEEWDGPPPHDGYLWMSGVWALAARVALSMEEHGWPAAIRGREDGLVGDLLAHVVPKDGRGFQVVGPLEIAIGDRQEYELDRAGFISLIPTKEWDSALFLSTPSCQIPKVYDQPEATAAASMASQIDRILCVSRFVHHLKVMCRDRTGPFQDEGECQAFLDSWLQQYVATSDEGPPVVGAARPLTSARVAVEAVADNPGWFRVVLFIKPAYLMDESPAPLGAIFGVSIGGA